MSASKIGGIIIGINNPERFSCYSHLTGALASVVGLVVLLFAAWGRWDYVWVCLIYGMGVINLFTSSALYHAFKQRENANNIWRKLDHMAIFIMIAGTYTPIAYIYLDGAWRWSIILIQWTLVALGMGFKISSLRAPRILSPVLYLLMGWLAVSPIRQLWLAMAPLSFVLLASGGIAFSIGAAIYIAKKPNPYPGVFGFHEIFHLFILLGGVLHFLVVYFALMQAP